MYEDAASYKDIARAPVTNWGPHHVKLGGYCYAVRQGVKVQLVTPYRVSRWQHYGVTVRGNVASVYPPLLFLRNTCFYAFFLGSADSPSGDTILYFIARLQKISNFLRRLRGL